MGMPECRLGDANDAHRAIRVYANGPTEHFVAPTFCGRAASPL